ncbi:MAG: hypothetical protein U0835_00350 [Isosphaeraceae bacterium]
MITPMNKVARGLTPTAVFEAVETVYGKTYRPVNKLAKDCARFAGVRELTADQCEILGRDVGFNVEVRG